MNNILVVDDDQGILELIESTLEVYFPSSTIYTCSNGNDVIEKVAQINPDLILLDINLPGKPGTEVCQTLKLNSNFKHIPVILMTGETTDRKIKIKSLEIGADAFLGKPFDLAEIAAQVKAMLRLKKAEDLLKAERDALKEVVKEQDKELSDKELRWQLVLQSGNDGIWDWNLKNSNVFISESMKNTLGYFQSDFSKIRQFLALIHKEDKRRVKKTVIAYLRKKTTNFKLEARILSATGEYKWMQYRGKAVWDKNDKAYRMIGVQTDISETKRLHQRLQELAHHDTLTSLPNRMLLFDRAEQVLAAATRKKEKVAIFFIDLDGFKQVNDTLGHSAGDELLQEVSYRLTFAVRKVDTVARIGGDEFAVMLPGIKKNEDITTIAKRSLLELSKEFELAAGTVHISSSIGISVFPEDGNDINALLVHADQAMYEVKQNGKNNFKYFKS